MVDNPVVRAAAPSVVRILGTACGLGISGSGWVAAPGIVVTAAHVVAGEDRTYVVQSQSDRRLIGPRDRLRLERRRCGAARARPDRTTTADGRSGERRVSRDRRLPAERAAGLGAGPRGPDPTILTEDAYGHGPVSRTVTSVGGRVRHGNSAGRRSTQRGAFS